MERVTKSFDSGDSRKTRKTIFEDLSLAIDERDVVTVLGPSGCGKTTLLRMIAGFEQPDRGQVLFDGAPVRGPGPDRVVVFQQPGLYPWLDVRHNIAFGLRNASRQVDWKRVDAIIDTVGLDGYGRYAPYELSGGMQQRVALARSLIMHPRMLLMDEPFAALDAHLRRSMQNFLLELCAEFEITVLFITHDVEEAIVVGQRVVVMGSSPGRILGELDAREVRPLGDDIIDDPRYRELRRTAVDLLGSGQP
ncbi:MAG TPA: ABC transporter ATP-binding protein [Acidimicrobiales bacterium]|nr:ABC transporter ATP-binding protein [Acidimicrobiales bacterium]